MITFWEEMTFERKVVIFKLFFGTVGLLIAFIYPFFIQADLLEKSSVALNNRVLQIAQKESDYYVKNGRFYQFSSLKQETINGLAALGFDPRPLIRGRFEYQVISESENSIRVEGRVKDFFIRSGAMPLLMFQKTVMAPSTLELLNQ